MKFIAKSTGFIFLLSIIGFYSPAQIVLYGMTSTGGGYINIDSSITINGGTIFTINLDPSGYKSVYSLPMLSNPYGNLLNGNNGFLYGMTSTGGEYYTGSIFSFNPSDTSLLDLHDFSQDTFPVYDGAYPQGSLVENNGILYGMTNYGGIYGRGIIFSYNTNTSTFSDLHDFDSVGGAYPHGSLMVEHNSGLLYGMTSGGGAYNQGVVFTFNTVDTLYTKIVDFGSDSTDGANPSATLMQYFSNGAYGILYGMTPFGGVGDNGTIFSINPANNNAYTKLYDFDSGNGVSPTGSLTKGSDGNLYGLTATGGINIEGNIFYFNIDSNTYLDLYDFDSTSGAFPSGGLLLASDSSLVGTTKGGGIYNAGTVFKYKTGFYEIYDFGVDSIDGTTPTGDLIQTSFPAGIATIVKPSGINIIPDPCVQCNLIVNAPSNDLVVTDMIGRNIAVTYTIESGGYLMNFPPGATGVFIIQNRMTGEVKKFVKE